MSITPLNDVVIIRKDKENERGGAIELLDSFKDPAGTETGTVVAIKTKYINEYGTAIYPETERDEKVLFLRKHGIAIKGEKELVCVRYNNILAVIE